MKRLRVDMDALAAWDNLVLALYKAARGKRSRADVRSFLQRADENLHRLQGRILAAELPLQDYRRFRIRDPKPRNIVAVGFELRVVHHAIMNLIGESLEKSQIHNSFACLPGRGVHAAVRRVQRGLRRAPWYVKIDIEKYFEHIDHALLLEKLRRRFKGAEFIDLLTHIVASYEDGPGRGLPIGSLTSQYFANFFLEGCDRMIERLPQTRGYVRYMDDMIWFCDSKRDCRQSLARAEAYLNAQRLEIKPNWQIQPTAGGVAWCGYRITPRQILLSRRKKRLWLKGLLSWERRWTEGEIDALALQRGYDAVHAATQPAQARGFRRAVLERIGGVEA